MFINIQIASETTGSELVALSNFTRELALNRGAPVSSGQPSLTVPAEPPAEEGEVVVVQVAGTEPPKRRRRSKEEVAAETKPELPPVPEEPVGAEPAGPGEIPAPSEPVGEVQAQPSEPVGEVQAQPSEPEAFETVTSNKDYTETEVQQLATVVARKHGADKVKDKIGELGAPRIAGMPQDKLNELGRYLEDLK